MFKQLIILFTFVAVPIVGTAQSSDSVFFYRRGSIYSVMISHRNLQFNNEIEKAFTEIPIPDKYYNHSIGKNIFDTNEKKLKIDDLKKHQGFIVNDNSKEKDMNQFDLFLHNQKIASRILSKWFARKRTDGVCTMQLIQDRGYNNATEYEKRLAQNTIRKDDLLRDAGEELIGSTFVLINDIRYIDRSKGSSVLGGIVEAAATISAISSGDSKSMDNAKSLGDMVRSFKGFAVKINSYLYQLMWDKETADYFYNEIYTETPNDQKRINFENNRGKFSLKYIGHQESSGSTVSFMGINEDEPEKMVRKACERALDENIANLQKNFDVFKFKTPIVHADPIQAYVGMKEGITPETRFEVLETIEDTNGKISYKKVGEVKPIKGLIWDNRYMAVEEKAPGATLGFTTFKKVSGKDIIPGMLIREIE